MTIPLKWIYVLNLCLDSDQTSIAIQLDQAKELTLFLVTLTLFSRSLAYLQKLILLLKM